MKASFLNHEKPLMTVMLQCETPELAIGRVRNTLSVGADAFGLQVESLRREFQKEDVFRRIFGEMQNTPCYVTNYRHHENTGKTDDELADGLRLLADCGATLCDVMGDLFDVTPGELTTDETAIGKQRDLIAKLHASDAEVLMSSHVLKFTPAERVLEIAREHIARGADISKIVTYADTMEEQIENMRIIDLLKRELGAPFLFLCGGECSILRRLGMKLGCCMSLCVYEHDASSTPTQPLLETQRAIRDYMGF